jgi:hypothetical protein
MTTNTTKAATIALLLGAAIAAPRARAQEFSRPGATLGALTARAGLVIEGDVESVVPAGRGVVATLAATRYLKGDAGPKIALFATSADSVAVPLAPGEHALFLVEAGSGQMADAPGAAANGLPIFRLEGRFLGKIETATDEGRAVAAQVERYLATAHGDGSRQLMLLESLSHWSPRIATDASYDLDAMGLFAGGAADAVIAALDRNRATYADLQALVHLAGLTGSAAAVQPLLDLAQEPGRESLLPGIGAALRRTGGGTDLVAVLGSALETSGDARVRTLAARLLGEMGDPAAADALARASADPDAGVRRAAIRGLGHLGEAGVPALEAALAGLAPSLDEQALAAVALTASPAGVRRLVALADAVPPELGQWIAFVRRNPAGAGALLGR